MGLTGVELEKITLDAMPRPLTATADTVEAVLAGQAGELLLARAARGRQSGSQRPSASSSTSSRSSTSPRWSPARKRPTRSARRRPISSSPTDYGARVRLTGPVPIADEEFATVQEGMVVQRHRHRRDRAGHPLARAESGRIILAVFINLVVGLAITAALGFLMVGPLNLISIAFAVLFVGLGVDFGIQYSVRYRADRFDVDDLKLALVHAARNVGAPLTLAAAATAAGFLSFLPTDYRGVSELGQIAGMGMLIAYLTSITLLPALLKVLNPPGEPEPLGFAFLAPVDSFMERPPHRDHRRRRDRVARRAAAALLPAVRLQPDQSAQPEGRVDRDLPRPAPRSDHRRERDQRAGAQSRGDAKPIEERLVEAARSLAGARRSTSSCRPIRTRSSPRSRRRATRSSPSFKPDAAQEPPTDDENVTALNEAVTTLNEAAEKHPGGPGAPAAKRLADVLAKLAKRRRRRCARRSRTRSCGR